MGRHRAWVTAPRPVVTTRTWFCAFNYAGDHPWLTLEHQETDPVRLVRWMRTHFDGSEFVRIKRLWEEG